MLNAKRILMLVVLSAGMLTALTGTGISQVAPAFADKEECEDNEDDNCNERTHKIIQENNCKAVNEFEHIDTLGSPTNDNLFTCTNGLDSPANGDDNLFDLTQPPGLTQQPIDVFALTPSALTP
ncbi:hypothetical protein BH18THE1_BH18THE1_01020 [soil metagenome]